MFSILGILDGRREYLADASSLRRPLTQHFAQTLLEAAMLPLHATTTNVRTGAEMVLPSDAIMPAVLVSAAIPGVFPPMRTGDHLLVDDGVANNMPISAVIRPNTTRAVVLPTRFACADHRTPRNAIEYALNTLPLLVVRQLMQDLKRWAGQVPTAVVPPLCPLGVPPYNYARYDELIDRAAAATAAWFAADGLVGIGVPGVLHTHDHNEDRPSCNADLHDIPTA